MTSPLSGGLLWKIPWRLSKFQKRRHRERLRAVDGVVATLDAALAKQGQTLPALEHWKAEMPTEAEMLPKDKYTLFDRKAKKYRKGIHSTSLAGEQWVVAGRKSHWLINFSFLQSCPSGREFPRESTLRVSKPTRAEGWHETSRHLEWIYPNSLQSTADLVQQYYEVVVTQAITHGEQDYMLSETSGGRGGRDFAYFVHIAELVLSVFLSWNELEKAPEFMELLFFAQGYHKTSSFRHSPSDL